MRSAFLADDRPAPVGATIRLTSRDASEGVTVPLAVPVRRTCQTCAGRGESWTEPCPTCKGSGAEVLRHELLVTVPAGVSDGTRLQLTVTGPQHPTTRVDLYVDVV
jgi:DnaJ-class molecular chaperone